MTRAEAEARVSRGAALLDDRWPGWAEQNDVVRLNIATLDCVLRHRGAITGSTTESIAYGLFVPAGEDVGVDHRSWQRLRDAWIAAIAARLSAAQQSEHEKEQTA